MRRVRRATESGPRSRASRSRAAGAPIARELGRELVERAAHERPPLARRDVGDAMVDARRSGPSGAGRTRLRDRTARSRGSRSASRREPRRPGRRTAPPAGLRRRAPSRRTDTGCARRRGRRRVPSSATASTRRSPRRIRVERTPWKRTSTVAGTLPLEARHRGEPPAVLVSEREGEQEVGDRADAGFGEPRGPGGPDPGQVRDRLTRAQPGQRRRRGAARRVGVSYVPGVRKVSVTRPNLRTSPFVDRDGHARREAGAVDVRSVHDPDLFHDVENVAHLVELGVAARRRALRVEGREVDVRRDPGDRVAPADEGVALAVEEELRGRILPDEAAGVALGDRLALDGLLLLGDAPAQGLLEHRRDLAKAARELAHHPDRDLGVDLEHRVERGPVDPHELDVGLGPGRGGARDVLEDAHLAEEVALLERREDPGLSADRLEQLDRSRLDDEHLRADVALGEDDFAHGVADEELLVGALPGTAGTGLEDGLHGRHPRLRRPRSRGTRGARRVSPAFAWIRTATPRGSVRGRGEVPRREAPDDGVRRPAKAVLEPRRDGLRGFAAAARAGRNRADQHGVQSIEGTRPLQLGQHSVQPVGLLPHILPEENGSPRRRSPPACPPGTRAATGTPHGGAPPPCRRRGRRPARTRWAAGTCAGEHALPVEPVPRVDRHLHRRHRPVEADEARPGSAGTRRAP